MPIIIISGAWAMTGDLLQYGGPAVEGISFAHVFDEDSKGEAYLKFCSPKKRKV